MTTDEAESNATDFSGWIPANVSVSTDESGESVYTFEIRATAYGYLHVVVSDYAGNVSGIENYRPLVVEDTAPQLTVTVDNNNYAQTHTFDFVAVDKVGSEEDGYSGIWYVEYSLWDSSGSEKVDSGIYAINGKVTSVSAITMPTAISNLKDYYELQTSDITLPSNLEGEYTLKVTAYDFCGNSASIEKALYFDNSAPTASVTMNSGAYYSDTEMFYYNEYNCGIDVVIYDYPYENDDVNEVSYVITLSNADDESASVKKEGTVTVEGDSGSELAKSETVSLTAAEVAEIGDGTISISIFLTDSSGTDGNTTSTFASTTGTSPDETLNETSYSAPSFILDMTAPVLVSVTDTTGSTVVGNYISYDAAIYYNADFSTYFEIEDENLDLENKLYASTKDTDNIRTILTITLNAEEGYTQLAGISGAAGETSSNGNGVYEVKLTTESRNIDSESYIYSLYVMDRAGNVLVAGDTSGDTSGFEYEVTNGTATLADARVIDNVAPKLVSVYGDVDEQGNTLGNYISDDEAFYYNCDFTTYFTVEDSNYYDNSSYVKVDASFISGEDSLVTVKTPVTEKQSAIAITLTPDEGVENNHYTLSLYVKDKAGNLLEEDSTAAGDTNGYGYSVTEGTATLTDTRVVDNVSPVLTDVKDDADNTTTGIYYSSDDAIYYNKEFTTTFTVTEANYSTNNDETLLQYVDVAASYTEGTQTATFEQDYGDDSNASGKETVDITLTLTPAGETANESYQYTLTVVDKAGNVLVAGDTGNDENGYAYEVTENGAATLTAYRVIDTVAPEAVITYSSTDNEEDCYDEDVAYYNTDIEATYVFSDSNLDTDKIYTGYTKDGDQEGSYLAVSNDNQDTDSDNDAAVKIETDTESGRTYTIVADSIDQNDSDHDNDGEYIFQAYGTDKAGNALTVYEAKNATNNNLYDASTGNGSSVFSGYTKVMDTIQPTVTITYTERDATYYYTEGVYYSESFSAEYLFEDTNLNTGYMYDGSGAVYTYGDTTASVITLTIADKMETDETGEETGAYIVTQTVNTDENYDGVYRFTVSGKDWAGNPVYVYEEQMTSTTADYTIVSGEASTTVSDGTYSTYTGDSKILDTTAPEVVITYTATDNEDDCYDDSDVAYYNLDFTATYTFTDYSLDYNKLFTNYSHDGEDQADEYDCLAETIKSQTSTSTTAKMTTSYTIEADDISELADGHDNDGTYLFKVYGEDKAGNGLIVTEYLTSGTVGDSYTSGTETAHNEDNPYTGYYSKVMDTIQPVVTITYTEREDTYYYEEGAYYNVDFNAFLTFADTNLNMDYVGSGYTFTQIGNGEVSDPTSVTEDNVITWTATTETGDGLYNFTVSGKDWAGNPVYVYEKQINGSDSEESNAVREDSTTVSDGTYSIYTTLGKIMDTTAPTLDIAYTALSDDYYYDDSEALDGSEINAYYNKAITTTYTFNDESGLDYSKIFAGRAFEADESLDTVDASLAVTAIGSTQADMTDGSDVVKSWTIPASESYNGIYHYLAYGEDKAGNTLVITENGLMGGESMTTEDCGTTYTAQGKVLDTVSPVYTSAMLPNLDLETNPDAVDELFSAYYNQDVKAQFTVEDTNIDTGLVNVAVTSFAGEVEDYYNYVPTWADITLTKTTQYATTQVYTTDTVSVDGVYRFEISGRDKAGNLLVQSEAEEAKAETYLETLKVTDGSYWTYNKVRDTVAPVLDMSILAGTTEIFAARLSLSSGVQSGETTLAVTKNMPYQSESTGSASIVTSDLSPTSIAYTFRTTGAGTDPTNTNMTRTYGTLGTTASDSSGWSINNSVSSITFDGQQTVEITLLSVKDRAGNEVVASVPTGSYYNGSVINKLYLDAQAPGGDGVGAVVGLSYPSSYSTVITGAGPVNNPLYNEAIQITATVEDPYGNADTQYASSGLYRVYFEVLVNGVAVDPGLVSASGSGVTGSEGSVGYIDYGTSGVGTDFASETTELNERLTYSDTITFTFNPEGSVFNDNDIELRVWVEDNAGNGGTVYDTNSSKNNYNFGIDITVPEITVTYDYNDAQNEFYFNQKREATVVVKERNFDPDTTYIETESTEISDWTYTAGSESNHDDDTWTATVKYEVDGDYTFTASTTDRAGWSNNGIDYGSSVAPESFTLDMTSPVIYVEFNNNEAQNGNYYLAVRTATITIEEHNFRSAEANVEIAKYVSDSVMTAAAGVPSEGSWTTNGDTSTAEVYFGDDGYYTMVVNYTDLAGNPAVTWTVDPFTIDLTAPTVDITAGGLTDQTIFGPDSEININVADWFDDTNIDPSAGVTFELEKMVWNTENKGASSDGEADYGQRISENENDMFTIEDPLEGNYSELRYLMGETDSYTGNDSNEWYQLTDTSESVDGLYRLTIYATDLAGNPSQDTVTFIINRYGSVYMVDGSTGSSVLTSAGNTYIQDVEGGLVIYELSLDVLSDGLINLYINGISSRISTVETSEEAAENGTSSYAYTSDDKLNYTWKVYDWDYFNEDGTKATEGGSETFGWVLRTYTLSTDAFKSGGQYVNGEYEIRIYSEDASGNQSWNYRTKDATVSEGMQARALDLTFSIDMEDPEVNIGGLLQDETYKDEYKNVSVTYSDNESLTWLGVLVTTNNIGHGTVEKDSYEGLEYYSVLFAVTDEDGEYYENVYYLDENGERQNVKVNNEQITTVWDEEEQSDVYSVYTITNSESELTEYVNGKSNDSDLQLVYLEGEDTPVLVYALSPLNLPTSAESDTKLIYYLRIQENMGEIYVRAAAGDEAGNRTDVTEDESIGHTNHTVTGYSFHVSSTWWAFIYDWGFDGPLQALLVFGGGAMVVIFAVTLGVTAIRRRRILVAGKKSKEEEEEEK